MENIDEMDHVTPYVTYDRRIILNLSVAEFNIIKDCTEKWLNQRAKSRNLKAEQHRSTSTRARMNTLSIDFPINLSEDVTFYAHGPPVEDEEEERIAIQTPRPSKAVVRPSIPSPSSTMPRRTPPKPKLSPKRKISPRPNPFVKDGE